MFSRYTRLVVQKSSISHLNKNVWYKTIIRTRYFLITFRPKICFSRRNGADTTESEKCGENFFISPYTVHTVGYSLIYVEQYPSLYKKVATFPSPAGVCVTYQTLNYSRPGRVSQVTSRLGTGMSLTFFYGAAIFLLYFKVYWSRLFA